MKLKKKIQSIISSVIFLLFISGTLAYLYASPYIAFHDLRKSILDRDTDEVEAMVNFPVLRGKIKMQLSSALMRSSKTIDDNDASKLGTILGSMFATIILEKFIDLYITPEGLLYFLPNPSRSDSTVNNSANQSSASDNPNTNITLATTSAYKNINTFVVTLTNNYDSDEHMKFILTRHGLDWKLTNILFAPKVLKNMFNSNNK